MAKTTSSSLPAAARPKILLGVSGSVATIKVGLLAAAIREFAEVKVIATEPARHFIRTLEPEVQASLGEVLGDDNEWRDWTKVGDPVLHIELRRWADALVIAPLSANSLAKAANGLCDNLLTCVVRAWDLKKPLLVAPAMNTYMWDSPFTQRHLDVLTQLLGATVVPPVSKVLACGDVGNGAMASYQDIAAAVQRACGAAAPLPAPPPAGPAAPYIPIIDLSPLTDTQAPGNDQAKAAMTAAVRDACLTCGFFYIRQHGVCEEDLAAQLDAARQLFDLPLTDKTQLTDPLDEAFVHCGYHSGQQGAMRGRDHKESFTMGTAGNASPMHGGNQWPPAGLWPQGGGGCSPQRSGARRTRGT